jgi:hypothetical protein
MSDSTTTTLAICAGALTGKSSARAWAAWAELRAEQRRHDWHQRFIVDGLTVPWRPRPRLTRPSVALALEGL